MARSSAILSLQPRRLPIINTRRPETGDPPSETQVVSHLSQPPSSSFCPLTDSQTLILETGSFLSQSPSCVQIPLAPVHQSLCTTQPRPRQPKHSCCEFALAPTDADNPRPAPRLSSLDL
ncbi:hypothetical protein XA68_13626 [Ophiocordyceps unilateralis]|uniref:Uncharacterized protein n=1 Tax=Ophiocordyceps unilateralis TaxID=268505 RepID=A0A2A9PAZ5_OPHUN|nr:hypothetical protein XA68_13626 [Ophiocordyceps unilateralis]